MQRLERAPEIGSKSWLLDGSIEPYLGEGVKHHADRSDTTKAVELTGAGSDLWGRCDAHHLSVCLS
jgi:hypothetical protein